MSNIFEFKKIHDPVHKTIGISKLELKIIDTKAFQRLRNIKQLSLIGYVFPGADYTRFSHSIGVCFLAGKVYDAIYKTQVNKTKKQQKEYDEKKQKIRLAGLLHDIGHYPFSHVMEDGIDFYLKKSQQTMWGLVSVDDARDPGTNVMSRPLDHENIGSKILEKDPEIKALLDEAGFDPIEISNLFIRKGESTSELTNLISSDLDVDRLDYLLRDSYYVGLPYGHTDLEYILRELTFDEDNKPCISPKALRTVDHFLLCRYFNYSQIIFHKSVAGFEEVLKRVISHLIEKNLIKYSETDILDKITDGTWYTYDDIYLMTLIRTQFDNIDDEYKPLFNSILRRIPPKEIVKLEYIDGTTQKKFNQFCEKVTDLNALIDQIADKFELNKNYIFVWNNGGLKLTKIGRMTELSEINKKVKENIDQSVRILDRLTRKSEPIMQRDDSLMSILSDKALYSVRLYVLDGSLDDTKIKAIREFIQKEMKHRDWK